MDGSISGVSLSTNTRSSIASWKRGPSPPASGRPARMMRLLRMSAIAGKFRLMNALSLMVRCLRARVPAITWPPNTTDTSREASSAA